MNSSTSYIVSDGLREIHISGKTSIHACRNFIRRLKKTGEKPGAIFYVRRGKGGSYEHHEVWYFSFQFRQGPKREFIPALLNQQVEPLFLHGQINHRKDIDKEPKNSSEKYRIKNRRKGLCELCGKEKRPHCILCEKCRGKRNKINRNKHKKAKKLKKLKIELTKTEVESYYPPQGIPTKHQPGSTEKVKELITRYENGEDFWHPEDSKMLITKEEHNAKIHNAEELSKMEEVET